ncbi:hypothetical protein [Vibrio comitans]
MKMERIYEPEGWCILKVEPPGQPHFYQVFGSWVGGFADPDKWRLSSGADDLDSTFMEGDICVFPQSSGSIYHLALIAHKQHNFYAQGVLNHLIEQQTDSALGARVSIIDLETQDGRIKVPFKEVES